MPLDYITDNNPGWLKLINTALPEWVKDATFPDKEELTKFARAAFADPINRLHPINTPASAFSSLAYLLAHGASATSPEVVTVKMAAAKWNISPLEIEAVENEMAQYVKSAAATTTTPIPLAALSVKNANTGIVENFYDISSIGLIEDSAEELARDFYRGKMPTLWCKDACANIKLAAARHGVPLSELNPLVTEMTEPRISDYNKSLHLAGLRKYANVGEHLETYKDIVVAVMEKEITPNEGVEMIESMDQSLGVKYSSVQAHPWALVYAGDTQDTVIKMASASVIISGVIVPAAVVAAISEDPVRMHFAKEHADAICHVIKTAATHPPTATSLVTELNEDIQKLLLELAVNDSGGLPVNF